MVGVRCQIQLVFNRSKHFSVYCEYSRVCHKAFGEVSDGSKGKGILYLLITQYRHLSRYQTTLDMSFLMSLCVSILSSPHCSTIFFGTVVPTVVITATSMMMIMNIKTVFLANANLSSKMNEKLRTVNKMVCILILSFAICWLPNAISNAMVLIITMNTTGVLGKYCWWIHMHSVQAIHTITQIQEL